MIRLRQIVSVAIAVFSPALAIAQGTTGTVTGVAREEGTGRPVPNARVTVVGTGGSTGNSRARTRPRYPEAPGNNSRGRLGDARLQLDGDSDRARAGRND